MNTESQHEKRDTEGGRTRRNRHDGIREKDMGDTIRNAYPADGRQNEEEEHGRRKTIAGITRRNTFHGGRNKKTGKKYGTDTRHTEDGTPKNKTED